LNRRLALGVALSATAAGAFAHHSVLPFDGTHGTVITGTVTRFLWQNPHTLIALEVVEPDGDVAHWTIEGESPRILARLGWTADSLEVGARVSVQGAAAKDGASVMRCREIEITDGTRLPCF
jgi:hypothetical protein